MKSSIYFIVLFFTLYSFEGQDESYNISLGIGTLEVNTIYPIPLYNDVNDSIPAHIIKFRTRKNGTTKFITQLTLIPYSISEGYTYKRGELERSHGLVAIGPELKFRVMDTTETSFKVLTNEKSNEVYYIKMDPSAAYYKSVNEVYENSCANCPDSKYNPNWNVFETWERYLKRVEFITKDDLVIYDKPNGTVIFENSSNNFLPFNVTEVAGEWVKLKKGFGREFNFDESQNYDGWTQWKKGNNILIDITEQTYE